MIKSSLLLAFVGYALAIDQLDPRSALSISLRYSKIHPEDPLAIQKAPLAGKATIEVYPGTNMPASAVNFARQTAGAAIDADMADDVAAKYIADEFAKKYPTDPSTAKWDCIVGNGFSAFVTRTSLRTFFAKVNRKTVLLYQTAN